MDEGTIEAVAPAAQPGILPVEGPGPARRFALNSTVSIALLVAAVVIVATAIVLAFGNRAAATYPPDSPTNTIRLTPATVYRYGVLMVALLVGALHFRWLRRDQRTAAELAEALPAPTPAAAVVEPGLPAPMQQPLVLSVPAGGDAGAALLAMRSTLPDGYRLDETG